MKKYYYKFDEDSKYCYKDSDTLINKYDIKDSNLLYELENDFTTLTIASLYKEPLVGSFDLNHLKSIHEVIFDDVYSWAGELRTVNISKGVDFCRYEYIELQFEQIYKELVSENYLLDLKNKDEAIKRYAYYLSEINAIHPFREGNGRTQRIYMNYLSRLSGYRLDFNKTNEEDMIEACYESMCGRYEKMEKLIEICISTISEDEKFYYKEIFGLL